MKRRRFLPYLQAKLALASLWSFAGVCAGLPFYVHYNPEKFGPPHMAFTGALEGDAAEVETARSANALLRTRLQIDQIMTGAIESPLQQKRPRAVDIPRQQFPGDENLQASTVQVISIAANRALAIVDGRMVILKPGDRLADGRVIAGFEQSAGRVTPIMVESDTDESPPAPVER